MKIEKNTLKHIEELAKLSVEKEEHDKTISKIAGVLNMLDKIRMEDIADLEPLYHPLEIKQTMRDDKTSNNVPLDNIKTQFSHTIDGLFLVPRVIE